MQWKKKDKDERTKLNFDGITFPFEVTDAEKAEKQLGFPINIFEIGKVKGSIQQMYLSKMKIDIENECNIGIITEKDNKHCVYIKDLNRLLHSTTKHKERIYLCTNCKSFKGSNKEAMEKHRKDCENNRPDAIVMPETEKDINIYFRNHKHKLRSPFVGYADFECLIGDEKNKKIREMEEKIKNSTDEEEKMMLCKEMKEILETEEAHTPSGYCFLFTSEYPHLMETFRKTYGDIRKTANHVTFGNNQAVFLYRGNTTDEIMRQFYEDVNDVQYIICAHLMRQNEPIEDRKKHVSNGILEFHFPDCKG
jgi:hypothetical protein